MNGEYFYHFAKTRKNVNYGLDVFAYFASHGWKEELEKKGKKLDEEDASDRGGDGDDADRKNVDVLPW